MAESILTRLADEAGWDAASQLALCLEYIGNQQDDATFEDFLRRQLADEQALAPADEATVPAAPPEIPPLTNYWLVILFEDVEASLQGPYDSEELRDSTAILYRETDSKDTPDGLHWLDIVDGVPEIGDYSGRFFEDPFEDDDEDSDDIIDDLFDDDDDEDEDDPFDDYEDKE